MMPLRFNGDDAFLDLPFVVQHTTSRVVMNKE
jgi:hypothetical protein